MILWRNNYGIIGDRIVALPKSSRLSVWAAVNKDTGQVDMENLHIYNDDLTELCDGWEWREFVMWPENMVSVPVEYIKQPPESTALVDDEAPF